MSKQFFKWKAAYHYVPSIFVNFFIFDDKVIPVDLIIEFVLVYSLLDASLTPFERFLVVVIRQANVFFSDCYLHITQISSCNPSLQIPCLKQFRRGVLRKIKPPAISFILYFISRLRRKPDRTPKEPSVRPVFSPIASGNMRPAQSCASCCFRYALVCL